MKNDYFKSKMANETCLFYDSLISCRISTIRVKIKQLQTKISDKLEIFYLKTLILFLICEDGNQDSNQYW